jgi:hypothetical protein
MCKPTSLCKRGSIRMNGLWPNSLRSYWLSAILFPFLLLSAGAPAFAGHGGSSQSLPAEDLIRISNDSHKELANIPVSVSRPFVQSEIRNFARAKIESAPLLTQCDVKNRWPDGSLKFAIVSFVVPRIPAKGSVAVSFSNQSSGNNTGYLDQAGMLDSAFNFEATIRMTGAVTQTISARQILSRGAFRYWLQGPIVTAVILEDRTPARAFDRDFGDGSKALHPIFEAWFYPQNHTVQVGYAIENTWASSNPAIDARDETYGLSLTAGLASPQTVFTNPTFTHIALSRWHETFWVSGEPPPIRVDHNIRYLVQTKAIPNYDTSLKLDPNLISAKYDSWVHSTHLLQGDDRGIGNYDKALDAGGAADWIGPMDTWDVLYLLTMDDRMLKASRGNANLAGRLPWHFREADTRAASGHFFDATGTGTVDTFGRVISVNARQQVTLSDLTPDQCGNDAPDDIHLGNVTSDGWGGHLARGHIPDVAYIPYLTSGEYYYLEELQYEAAYIVGNKIGCYAPDLSWPRQGNAGYLNDSELRGDAWGFRTLAYAAFISPDGAPEKAYFEDKLKNNIALWEGGRNLPLTDLARRKYWKFGYDMQRDPKGESPLGSWTDRSIEFVQPPLKDDGSLLSAASPWEEGFMVYSLGMARDFGYDTGSLLQFASKRYINQCLNPATDHILIEAYRYPTQLKSTGTWIQDWRTNDSEYEKLPTTWQVAGSESADHSYGFIAMAAISFLYPYTDPQTGYKAKDAWSWIRSNKPNQYLFSSASPKWDILPRTQ